MKTYLVNTIVGYLSSPQGPARLHGHVRRAGLDVTFLNLNHDIYTYFFSARVLRKLVHGAEARLLWACSRDRFQRRALASILVESSAGNLVRLLGDVLTDGGEDARRLGRVPLLGGLLRAYARSKLDLDRLPFVLLGHLDEVTRRIGDAQETMDDRFMRQDPKDIHARLRTLLCGKAIVDAFHHPAGIDLGFGFWGTEWDPTAARILEAVRDERHNYLLPYFRSEVLPALVRDQPGLVGLSATHPSEFVPVWTLATLIRDALPETHIVLGGAAVSDVRDRIAVNEGLWGPIDSLVYGPGEIAFLELAEALETGRPLARVPNLVYRERGRIRVSSRTAILDPNDAATPEYVNLRPGAWLALETSSSCYWGRCAFCFYPRQGSSTRRFETQPYRERSLDRVFEDMRTVVEKHDPCFLAFTDSTLSPDRLRSIARYNRQASRAVPFTGFVRLEEDFASGSVCRELAQGGFLGGNAGLESASARTNRRIQKGVNLERVPAILATCHENGLLMHLFTIVGFPGETEEEARRTCRFLRRHRRHLGLDWQVYALMVLENAPLAERAEEFGLAIRPFPREYLVPVCMYDVQEGLSQSDSIRLSLVYEDRLARYRHPLSRWLDVESYKLLLLHEHARRRRGRRAREGAPARAEVAPP